MLSGSRMLKRIWISAALMVGLAAPAAAVPVVYTVTSGGVDTAAGCSSHFIFQYTTCNSGASLGQEYTQGLPNPAAATGTYTLDDAADTLDVALSVSSLTLVDLPGGPFNGVDEIVFTGLTYTATGLTVTGTGDGPHNLTLPATISVSGTYEEFLAGGSVGGPTAFGPMDVDLTAGQCAIVAGAMTCGLTVGAQGFAGSTTAFELAIGGVNRGFLHQFNTVALVPEPGTALLLGLGLAGVAATRRRR